ncbi:MAG: hypothetical protein RLZ10_2179, partial [Bacteroidota bacterium]
ISELGINEYVDWVKEMNKDGIKSYLSLENLIVVDQFLHDSWYKLYPEDLKFSIVKKYIASGKKKLLNSIQGEQLSIITFGSGSTEAMVAKRPLITTFTDFNFYENERPPHFNAFTEEEIYDTLYKIHHMSDEELGIIGQNQYDFIYKFHHYEVAAKMYIDMLTKAVNHN